MSIEIICTYWPSSLTFVCVCVYVCVWHHHHRCQTFANFSSCFSNPKLYWLNQLQHWYNRLTMTTYSIFSNGECRLLINMHQFIINIFIYIKIANIFFYFKMFSAPLHIIMISDTFTHTHTHTHTQLIYFYHNSN